MLGVKLFGKWITMTAREMDEYWAILKAPISPRLSHEVLASEFVYGIGERQYQKARSQSVETVTIDSEVTKPSEAKDVVVAKTVKPETNRVSRKPRGLSVKGFAMVVR